MSHAKKLALSVTTAGLILSLAVGVATANRLAASEDEFDIRWSELTFSPNRGGPVSCEVTLLGRFNSRTVAKEGTIGVIDHAAIGAGGSEEVCEGGEATVLHEAEEPWAVGFESFTGTLPNISSITLSLIGASFQIVNELGLPCLAETDTTEPAVGIASLAGEGTVTGLAADPDEVIAADAGFLCILGGVTGAFSGRGTVEDRHEGPLIITLA